ncbi:trp operon leader peptide [Streptomyces sp. NPDC005279]|uniref:trp operon leader peptide n=1 Tax=Streptomyces sp. NPDC005279 TaxID=3364712 RepID=UPI00369BFA3A
MRQEWTRSTTAARIESGGDPAGIRAHPTVRPEDRPEDRPARHGRSGGAIRTGRQDRQVVAGRVTAASHSHPSDALRAAGGCVMVGVMFAQPTQNWWWTAHPAAH